MTDPKTTSTGTTSDTDSGVQPQMRHLLISVSYEGAAIAPSTIFSAIRDRLEEQDREAVEGKAWHSPTFVQPQTASVWDAWWNLTDPERAMIQDLYPQLHAALYLLHEATSETPLHKAPIGYPDLDPSVTEQHKWHCHARHNENALCSCSHIIPRMAGKDSIPHLTLEEMEAVVDGKGAGQKKHPMHMKRSELDESI